MGSREDTAQQGEDRKYLVVTRQLRIPLDELDLSFSRSSGPGGQNVNKVNSKVQLRWKAAASPNLPAEVRARFLSQNRNRITVEGDLVITSQRFRDQARNIDDCREKLQALLRIALIPPRPRKKTKPTAGSRRRRLADKRQRATVKQLRRSPPSD